MVASSGREPDRHIEADAGRRVADDGTVTYSLGKNPLGKDAQGLLVYMGNGRHTMFKQGDQALVLFANPRPHDAGRHAGPTFEWSPP